MSLIFILDPVFTPLSGALFSWYLQIALTESYLSKGERHN